VGDQIGIDQRLGERVPMNLAFRDETGAEVRLDEILDKRPAILSLVYYECPMLCTQVLNGLLRSLRVLSLDVGGEFEVITVSIDPGETPALAAAKKKEYVGRYGRDGAAGGWHFLTGTRERIEELAEAVGFRYEYDPETDLYVHASGIMVLTPAGELARYFYGVEYAPKDLRLGLIEAAEERIGNAVDQVLLLCYQYDPTTGKYGLVILNSLRVAGAATVAVLAALVIGWIRRERRQAGRPAANPIPQRN
jgi:protein SCO1/2